MNPSQQTSLQVLDTLDMLVRHWNRADIPAILSYSDPACSGFGPGPEECFWGCDQFQVFLDRETGHIKELSLTGLNIEAVGTVSWVSGSFHSRTERDTENPQGRFTAVLKGTGHAWVLVHLHLSFPSDHPSH